MIRHSRYAALVLMLSVAPARAEDAAARALWDVFAEQCTRFVDAKNAGVAVKAMDGFDTRIGATPDGWGMMGSATPSEQEDGVPSYFLSFTSERDDDGEARQCMLQTISLKDADLPDLTGQLERHGAALLGEGGQSHGGALAGGGEDSGRLLVLETPGFPPRLSLRVLSNRHFVSVSMTAMRPAD